MVCVHPSLLILASILVARVRAVGDEHQDQERERSARHDDGAWLGPRGSRLDLHLGECGLPLT